MIFDKENDFEEALIALLKTKGWENNVLEYYSEKQLIQNWADILYNNNRNIDRLGDYPLTDGEMQQILDQVVMLKTPLRLNGFINGGFVSVKRDNQNDVAHFGKEVALKIYERREIAAGQSRYQIARQPQFRARSPILNDRRGDLMLLINGMPVIHIELKSDKNDVSQACYQIQKYSDEGIFTGIFSLIQVFVAMNPHETLYFANPGPEGRFNPKFFFHWADFDNEPMNDWKLIGSTLLSIPMAHQLVGFYTVADDSDGCLKVMRSYQYNAANQIADKVSKTRWDEGNQLGGYIWHTTGSGKTMTSYKSAELIASSKDADKVVFLMDRIELGTQSLSEYRNFAGAGLSAQQKNEQVQGTEDTTVLVGKLKSSDPKNTLIVTSIQKMSNIVEGEMDIKGADIREINAKRLVFIIDECHRSTFGEMLLTIKKTFPRAIFFGFTGTPIHEENQKRFSTTATVFGNELHRYSIADGIRDGNVLGFDPYQVCTFTDDDVRRVVALEHAKADTVEEVMKDEGKKKIFNYYMYDAPMCSQADGNNKEIKGIEAYLPMIQYRTEAHQAKVVEDILKGWDCHSQCSKYHAIFATSSINEALEYYQRFKTVQTKLKVCALFDPNIDNKEGAKIKEDGLVELIQDYNHRYKTKFRLATFHAMKKDIASRLAHKGPYTNVDKDPDNQIDILIVVDQMLTGFDSKWVNTLYLDKVIEYENIIQAFSRTNRVFEADKPFGIIKYYRKPHTMKRNIEEAVKLYSGDKPYGLFAQRLNKHIEELNRVYGEIVDLYASADIENFEKLPEETEEKQKFAKLFKEMNKYLEAAKVQGFTWDISEYVVTDEDTGEKHRITVSLDKLTYSILLQRYSELFILTPTNPKEDIPYDIEGYLISTKTDRIDANYMNSRFKKYLKLLHGGATDEELKVAKDELHRTFATLSQDEQKFAIIFLHDIESGDIIAVEGKTFKDYVTEYMANAKNDRVHRLSVSLGIEEDYLRTLMNMHNTEQSINEFGRFDKLLAMVDDTKASIFLEKVTGKKYPIPMTKIRITKMLRDFLIKEDPGFEIPE